MKVVSRYILNIKGAMISQPLELNNILLSLIKFELNCVSSSNDLLVKVVAIYRNY